MCSMSMVIGAMGNNALICTKLLFKCDIVPEERAVLIREQASSLYDVSAYFFAKILGEMPFSLIYPLFVTLILYWAIPLNTSSGSAFIIFCTILLNNTYSVVHDCGISGRSELFVVDWLVYYQSRSAYNYYSSMNNLL